MPAPLAGDHVWQGEAIMASALHVSLVLILASIKYMKTASLVAPFVGHEFFSKTEATFYYTHGGESPFFVLKQVNI